MDASFVLEVLKLMLTGLQKVYDWGLRKWFRRNENELSLLMVNTEEAKALFLRSPGVRASDWQVVTLPWSAGRRPASRLRRDCLSRLDGLLRTSGAHLALYVETVENKLYFNLMTRAGLDEPVRTRFTYEHDANEGAAQVMAQAVFLHQWIFDEASRHRESSLALRLYAEVKMEMYHAVFSAECVRDQRNVANVVAACKQFCSRVIADKQRCAEHNLLPLVALSQVLVEYCEEFIATGRAPRKAPRSYLLGADASGSLATSLLVQPVVCHFDGLLQSIRSNLLCARFVDDYVVNPFGGPHSGLFFLDGQLGYFVHGQVGALLSLVDRPSVAGVGP